MALTDTLKLIITADSSKAQAAFKNVGKDAEKSFGQAGEGATKLGTLLANPTTAAIAAGTAIVAFGKASVDAFQEVGTETLKVQRYLGGTAEEASSLRFAAKQTGTDIDGLTKGLGFLSKSLVNSPEAFKQYGISTQDAQGHTLDLHQILLNTADTFSRMPNGADKTAAAIKLFGRAGADMLPFLNRGRDGIEALEKQTDKYGELLSGKNLGDIKANKQAQRELTAAIEGLKVELGSKLLPEVTKATTGFTDLIMAYRKAGDVFGFVDDHFFGMATSMAKFVPVIGSVVQMIDTRNQITDLFGGKKASLDMDALAQATHKTKDQVQDFIDTQKAQGITYATVEDAAKAYKLRVGDVADAEAGAADQTQSFTDKTKEAADALNDANKELDEATKKVTGYFDAITHGTDLEADYQQAVDKLTDSIKENGATTDVNTEKGRNNRKAILDVRDAILEKALAHAKETGNVKDAINDTDLYVLTLEKQLRQSGFSQKAAEDYINQLGLTPASVETAFIQSGLQTGINDAANFKSQLDSLNGRVIVVGVGFLTEFGSSFADIKTQLSIKGGGYFRAHGGPVHRGESYIVGDRRGMDTAEVFTPNTDGTIYPSGAGMDGGGSAMPLQAVIVIDGKPFAQVMTTAQRTDARGRRWAPSQ